MNTESTKPEDKATQRPWMQAMNDPRHIIKNVNGQGMSIGNIHKVGDAELIVTAVNENASLKSEIERLKEQKANLMIGSANF